MQKYKIQRQYIFSTKTYKEVAQFLDHECEHDLDLMAIKDEKGNTALHQCAYFNSVQVMQKYLDHMHNYILQQGLHAPTSVMDQFVNLKNDEGLTAVHFAAYKGHFRILDLLQKNRADIYSTSTANQQNILHLAAQNDKVETFIYFNSALNINKSDRNQQTALHMAAQRNCESVVTYLLAQPNILIDLQDNTGQTALHYATAYGNTKVVKRLLKAGANRNIQNNGGETALQIAKRHQFRSISRLLDEDFSVLDRVKIFMNLKTQYQPQKKSWGKPVLFIVLFLAFAALRFSLFNLRNTVLQSLEITLDALVIGLYLILLIPGKKIERKEYEYFLYSYQKSLKKVCLICVAEKPRRSLHCDICKNCVERYDHHCHWINNCVGRFNHNRFFAFITLFLVFLLVIGVLGGLVLYHLIANIKGPDQIIIMRNEKPENVFKPVAYVFSALCLLVFTIFIVPVSMLYGVQAKNLCLNKTTYQRFTKDKLSQFTETNSHIIEDQIKINKKKSKRKYSMSNVRHMCFGSDIQIPLNSEQSMLDSA